MPIKIIAPLSPAGEFPVADANNISLSSEGEAAKPGSVAAAVSELQQELGIATGAGGSVSTKIDDLLTNFDDFTSTTSENLNLLTGNIENESESIKEALSALRSHMNTMLPPTLRTSSADAKLYHITATPTLTITVSVNRPLEAPLKIETDGDEEPIEVLTPEDNSREATITWEPTWQSASGLPYSAYKVIRLVNASDSEIVYATKTESCTFAENVYYGASNDAACTTPEELVDHTGETVVGHLSAGHPASISFKNPPSASADGSYYYYMCPESYGEPIITSGGLDAGFINLGTTEPNTNGISYYIYRSEYKLGRTTVSIK